MAARIALLDTEQARKAAADVKLVAQFADLNVFRAMLRHPTLAKAVGDLLVSLLFRGSLDDRLRELVIMRIGWATGSDYEWTQHWSVAQQPFGCSAEDLLGVREWRDCTRFGEPERAVLAATDETLETGTLCPETWSRCLAHVGDEVACMELVAAIGTWRWVSQFTRSLEIPLEAGISSWPPDGEAPV